ASARVVPTSSGPNGPRGLHPLRSPTMRTFAALSLALLIPLAGCGDDGSGPEEQEEIFGTYTLRTINGNAVPFTLGDNGSLKVEVTGGHIVLNEDLSYSEIRGYRTTENGVITTEDEAYDGTYTYSFTNGDLTITTDGLMYLLSLRDRTITERAGGFTIVWTR